MMRCALRVFLFVGSLSCAVVGLAAERAPSNPSSRIDFARDIRPIFAKSCYSCHGAEQAESSLRLDRKADALRGGSNGPAIIPGKSGESRLVSYITGANGDELVMPPEGQRLAESQIAMIRTWIDQGARWPDEGGAARKGADHWSFQPIKKPALPRNPEWEKKHWIRNGIDALVVAKLQSQGIAPSPEADRATLIRRLSIDLLGLPPAPADVEEFVRDQRSDAYERLVDRLLASPHYGERWARHWLDLARYADSDGYEKDTPRPHAWRYRNWVIEALNRDLPFDQFTIEQLAGDLLPDATLDKRIATGFHRNTLTNREGGVDQEEFRVAATVDRVNTTGSVWLGLTVGCAQCHTHKYDPIANREYYGLFAFFNSEQEVEIAAPLPEQAAKYELAKKAFDAGRAPLVAALNKFDETELPERAAKWEASLDRSAETRWTIVKPETVNSTNKLTLKPQDDGAIMAVGDRSDVATFTITAQTELKRVTALRIEAITDSSLPKGGPGRAYNGNFVLSEVGLTILPPGVKQPPPNPKEKRPADPKVPLRYAAADFAQNKFAAEMAIDGSTTTGWAVNPQTGRNHELVIELQEPVDVPAGAALKITLDHQNRGEHILGRFRLSVTDSQTPVRTDGVHAVRDALAIEPAKRMEKQKELILDYYRPLDEERVRLNQAIVEHDKKAPVDPGTISKAQALVELSIPRKTHILVRGDFLRPGAEVEPHTLEVLPPLKIDDEERARLAFARWLVSSDNPLTARVTVNRFWAQFFGRGIVPSVNDFGTQGEKPSHPELLDWLAREFMETGWSMKGLHKLIVTSATYRQSSVVRPELAERDPYNVLLARQRRLRVEAEIVRDLALASSGLLTETIGGPSVSPKQPAGVSELTYAGSAKWVESSGPDRYRRGLYINFRRTSPYPMLMTFDAPDSNVTCTRRERSNTPLQALTLLNDPVFFECAQHLGRRIVIESPKSADANSTRDARLRYAMCLCLARDPSAEEIPDLRELYDTQLALCQADVKAARELAGSEKSPDGASVPELAAWIVVGRTLMNLDEFITRE
jgi:hypothetical protein